MKKLFLSGAALLCFASPTHAQINQSGTFQSAEQNRTGNNQTGTISQAQGNADRTNFGNYAITFQTAPGNGGANTANVNQNNGSQGNRAGITQSGGAGNLAQIDQNGGNYGLSGGASSVSATIGRAGELGNFAGIAQVGTNNSAFLSQNNNSQQNGSEIYQNGIGNAAVVEQNDGSRNNVAFIFQGYIGQNQLGPAVTNSQATISQTGPNPVVGGVGESASNTAAITQTASYARAGILQGNFAAKPADTFLGTSDQYAGASGYAIGSSALIEQLDQAAAAITTISQGTTQGNSRASSASVRQAGPYNFVQVGQGVSGSDYGSIARIAQTGKTTTSDARSVAYVFQGNGGSSYLSQAIINQNVEGMGMVSINQGVGRASSTRDQAIATQSSRAMGLAATGIDIRQGLGGQRDIVASISQDNQAVAFQGADILNGNASIVQGGSTFGASLESVRNTATITQIKGTNVRARIGQALDYTTPISPAFPAPSPTTSLNGVEFGLGTIARDNRADITQAQGDGSYALLLQSGEQNIGRIIQQGQDNNFALIVQTQNANRAIATINQLDGSANQATIQQFGSASGEVAIGTADQAIINQFKGSNNIVFLQQGTPGGSGSGGNYAVVTQNGNANQARFLQQGVGNFVSITQNGDGNEIRNGAGEANSYGSQVGNNNSLRLVQSGGSNRIFSYTQVGNNNTQVISQ